MAIRRQPCRLLVTTLGVVAGVVLCATVLRADDDSRALIERAIQAQGGEEQVAKLIGPWRAKIKGIKDPLVMTGEMSHQAFGQGRIELRMEIDGKAIHVIAVTNGDRAWQSINGQTREITGDELREMQDGGYRSRKVRFLLPILKEPGITLSRLPDQAVAGRPAAGVRVQKAGHRDVDIFFDKESALLVKIESRVRNPEGKELVLEQVFSNYRDFDGLKFATTFTKYENGKLLSVEEITELTFVERIDPAEFAKP